MLDSRIKRKGVKQSPYITICEEIGQHYLLFIDRIVMKRLTRGVAEELDELPELGLKRGFGNNQIFLCSGPCWRLPHIVMVSGLRAYLHAISLAHAHLC